MTDSTLTLDTFAFDAATRALVRLAARIAAGSETEVRAGVNETVATETPARWVEEVILQSYLFAGFPRALNAAREYRRVQGKRHSGVQGKGHSGVLGKGQEGADFRALGEATCALVYGKFYNKLRHNIVELHPELDEWMILEGYGKVLSRPGLDLVRRELCIVASCVAAGQDRQLHSHLHGARNVGAPARAISDTLEALDGVVDEGHLTRALLLWARVRGR